MLYLYLAGDNRVRLDAAWVCLGQRRVRLALTVLLMPGGYSLTFEERFHNGAEQPPAAERTKDGRSGGGR